MSPLSPPQHEGNDDCCNGLQKLSSANNDGLHLIESGKLMWFVTMVLLIRNEKFRGFPLEDNAGGNGGDSSGNHGNADGNGPVD